MVHDFDPQIAITPLGPVYWYGAVYSLGFVGIFLWFRFRKQARGMTSADVFTLTILFAVGVMLGGRIFDILVYELDYYRDRPLAALNWWEGGMASHGVLLGGLVATALFARMRGDSLVALLDEVVVPGAFLLAVGRLGNFIEGGVVGSATTVPWGFAYPDLEGARHPVALYESAKNFAILPVLVWAIGRWQPGRGVVASLFVFLYAGLRFAVDLFRDYEAAWLGIGTGQVFNLLMAGAGLVMLIWTLRSPQEPAPVPSPRARAASWWQVAALVVLILYPLGIPTSWTRANIAEKRQETMEDARITAPDPPRYFG
ncbi:prolipoprotein diacylglyceryl transferase [Salipiger mucosus]|uniref:Phosphatidylglycerol--prolipoprotein diacylglyceryl transferase n=1 Tax=Salipiger mucosus DSM 16094 TaxID=1123237 RepID=S9RJL7_9RHOB|nr:prolipoprotein diacylglyceryl transferase [Salipiger mucosus]EPX78310.1 Prolipoprotein diacylglyceryl transferase [Salipiger mucosus DSM 16094]